MKTTVIQTTQVCEGRSSQEWFILWQNDSPFLTHSGGIHVRLASTLIEPRLTETLIKTSDLTLPASEIASSLLLLICLSDPFFIPTNRMFADESER